MEDWTEFNLALCDEELQILQMALSEYVGVRTPVPAYIEKRYPSKDYPESFRKMKLLDVEKRIVAAEELRNRLFPPR